MNSVVVNVVTANDEPEEGQLRKKSVKIEQGGLGQGDSVFRFQKLKKPRARNCKPVNPPFDNSRYVEVFMRFDALRNFDKEVPPFPGQYVIRASCMGKVYGHFVSQSLDQKLPDTYDTAPVMCPDIAIDEELVFYSRFLKLIDNPILLSLLDTAGSEAEYEELQPIGYICLDIPNILNYESGIVEEHLEPWVIPDANIQSSFLNGSPMLKLSLECQRGIPNKLQLRQGNIMTVCVESMSHLPEEITRKASNPESKPEMTVMITLPHSDKEPILEFVGGRLTDGKLIEPPLTTLRTLNETTQTADASSDAQTDSEKYAPTRHWATIPQFFKDVPLHAAAISTPFAPEMEDGSVQVSGDAKDAYENTVGYCHEPQLLWESVHKRYIPADAYKRMLTRLSQDVIWPLEIAVTVNKKALAANDSKAEFKANTEEKSSTSFSKTKHKKKKHNKDHSSEESRDDLNTSGNSDGAPKSTEEETPPEPLDESEILYMNELGRPVSSETTLVYHGIAFVDLSRLVYPGVQKVRFACKLYPFSQQILMAKTCLIKSAFAEALDGVSVLATRSHMGPNTSGFLSTSLESGEASDGGQMDCSPFIVFEIGLQRSIIPLYKTPTEIPEVVQDYIPAREIPRRKLINSGLAQQKLRRAVLEAAAEISTEFTNHYWKEIIQGGQEAIDKQTTVPPTLTETLKKGFVFYLNASGRYLVIREHLRQAVSLIVQQRCLNLRPSGFQSHRDFQSFLHDMYNYLVDEVHETLNRTALPEVDPLDPIPGPPKSICNPEAPASLKELEQKTLLRQLLFYSEESFAQGDFDNCHRLHLQRICRSKEDPNCWVDFSIMWLSRGDDRMAEIAVREALRNESKNIYALIIGGLIAIRHNDERGIDCLGAAIGLKPLNPEILVIMGLAHATIGNEMAADFFFRKAAYLHRTLTGKDTGDIDRKFDMLSKYVGVKQSIQNISKTKIASQAPSVIPDVFQAGTASSSDGKSKTARSEMGQPPPSETGASIIHPLKKKHSDGGMKSTTLKPQKSGRLSKTSTVKGSATHHHHGHPSSSHHKHSEGIYDDGLAVEHDQEEEEETPEDDFFTRKVSISRGNPRRSSHYQPRFDFTADLQIENLDDSILPGLRPSLQIPWNITEYNDKLKAFLDAANEIEDLHKPPSGESGIAHESVIKAEYDKIIGQPMKPTKEIKRKSNVIAVVESGNEDEDGEMLSDLPQREGSGRSDEEYYEEKRPVYINRLGSELIWAGQLLLQLRMFDMLDGVLTRELYVSGSRSIQFLYLRAMSLYFRQSYKEAISIFDEAIQIDPENAILCISRGHCFYEMGQNEDALRNYEKALRLPVGKENRHLLYLRFATLSLDAGNYSIAKRVFLHGIQKYPTPYMWLATGNTCFKMGDNEQAEAAFAEANRLDNTNPITWAHLALINLTLNQQGLAEQSYKWALRFGLKKGKILDEIKRLQQEKGFGDPSFPRVPNCIPHDYYVRRLGRQKPFDIYRDALINDAPTTGKKRYEDTEREKELKRKLMGDVKQTDSDKQRKEEIEVSPKNTGPKVNETELAKSSSAPENQPTKSSSKEKRKSAKAEAKAAAAAEAQETPKKSGRKSKEGNAEPGAADGDNPVVKKKKKRSTVDPSPGPAGPVTAPVAATGAAAQRKSDISTAKLTAAVAGALKTGDQPPKKSKKKTAINET